MQKALPIGNDQFRIVREKDYYYIDKTLLIKEFLELRDTASLITRPRRFGKTLNMTMLREFFDITRDSREIFKGLAIMDTKYASLINTKPVIYFSFKDCSGKTQDELKVRLSKEILKEYQRYAVIFESGSQDKRDVYVRIFYNNLEKLISCSMSFAELSAYVEELIRVVHDHYGAAPILLIDEYDQPVLSSYENGYRKELGDFFSSFYGSALKGNEYMDQALLTGIQRVAKESIFSKLNNISIYTVIDECYSDKFGITKERQKNCSVILAWNCLQW
ncbi:AAA family ATPase [Blautia sp. RD014234]|nr:AAA family ATPase [Blautia parvula]